MTAALGTAAHPASERLLSCLELEGGVHACSAASVQKHPNIRGNWKKPVETIESALIPAVGPEQPPSHTHLGSPALDH